MNDLRSKILFLAEPLVLGDHQGQFFLPEHPEEPEFADSETNVTAQLGGSVFLHCPVVNTGDRAVSYPTVSTTTHSKHAAVWQKNLGCLHFSL